MEGTKVETFAEDTTAFVSDKFDKSANITPPNEQPLVTIDATILSEPEQASEVTNVGTEIAGGVENLLLENPQPELSGPPPLDQLAEVEVPSVKVNEPVDMAVKARRDFVLGNQTLAAIEPSASNRRAESSEQLRNLAEDMEYLSIDLIYQ